MTKRALVLEGGGAKGAYALGCLRAFREKGVQFDAVAGTSVGALNAVLWSTGQLDKGTTLWRSIKPWRVFPFRRPALFFAILFFPHAASRFVLWWLRKSRIGEGFERAVHEWVFMTAAVVILGFVAILATFAIASLYDRLPDVGVGSGPADIVYGLTLPLRLLLLFGSVSGFLILPHVLERMGISLLETRPLMSQIHDILAKPLLVPVYIVYAHEKYVWDPKALVESPATGHHGLYIWWPRYRYVARYKLLQEIPAANQGLALLASASLPFGIVPSVLIDGEACVDGGVVDNLPIYPVVRWEKCEHLVIIQLRPVGRARSRNPSSDLRKLWKRQHYKVLVSALRRDHIEPSGPRLHRVDEKPPYQFSEPDPVDWPAHITVVAPRCHLELLSLGTVNFFGWYTKWLERKGYEETINRPKAWWDAISATSSKDTVH